MTLEINYDKNIQNTLELKIQNETHSLGSTLSEKLGKDDRCLFSSYKVLHPKDNFMYLRVGCDNSIAVKEYIIESLKYLETCTQDLLNQINNL